MIPALISSVVILYLYWRENRPLPSAPEPDSPAALEQEIAELTRRLDAIQTRLQSR